MHQVSFSNKYLLLKVDKYLLTFVINILNAVENYQTNIIIYNIINKLLFPKLLKMSS